MIFLIDSSAWIEYFRGNQKYLFISDLIKSNAICTNDIILTELLPSILHKNEHHLAELLNTARKYTLFINWVEIRSMQLLNLKHGNNNMGISDLVIAQNCIQNGLTIISQDKHFKTMAKYIPVKVHE